MCLYTGKEQSEIEIQRKIPFTIATNMDYLEESMGGLRRKETKESVFQVGGNGRQYQILLVSQAQ